MFLRELFEDPTSSPNTDDNVADDHGEMTTQLRQAALEMLVPMLSQNVPFVTIQQVIDGLSTGQFGIVITPSIIMDVLDPDKVKAVSKIEGDRIYLNDGNAQQPDRETDQAQQQQDRQHVSDMASQQIKKDVKSKPPTPPTRPTA